MTSLARNVRIRLLAALMLLVLRPCIIFLSDRFLSSQSGNGARIEYIDDDRAIENVILGRDVLIALQHAGHATAAFLPSRVGLRWAPTFSFILSQCIRLPITQPPVSTLSCRSPPSVIV